MEICDYEKVIGDNLHDIVKGALDSASFDYDSVVQMGVEDGKLYYCGLSSNESENPENKVVEVYRLTQSFDFEEACGCSMCDDCNDNGGACNEEQLYSCTEDCLIEEVHDIGYDDMIISVSSQIQEWGYDML